MEDYETIEFTEEQVKEALKGNYKKAEETLKDKDKVEKYLRELEEKLKSIPTVGNVLSKIPMLISMVRRFIKKEYADVPIGTIVAVMAALLYVLMPVDAIPDVIPGVGYLDDAAVVALCVKMVGSDLERYDAWRKQHYPEEVQA